MCSLAPALDFTAAAVTGALTLIGVLASNSRSRAVMEYKIDSLREHVEKHNQVIERVYALEKSVSIVEHDVEDLVRKAEQA